MNKRKEEVRETLFPTLYCLTCETTYFSQDGRIEGTVCNALIPVLKCDAGHEVSAVDNSIAGARCGYQSKPGGEKCLELLRISDNVDHCRGILMIKLVGLGVPRNDRF